MGKDKRFLGDKGMALITVLLMAGIIVLMTTSMVYISTSYMNNVGNLDERTKALRAAEAGIEYAIYRLDEDPTWGCTGFNWSGTCPTFSPDTSIVEPVIVSNDAKFTISFGGSYSSENNLFGTAKTSSGVPAYTAKIVSVGQSGTSKKILEANLVRSDYYPNTVTSGGRVILSHGHYTLNGETYGSTPEPGYVLSTWKNTPIPGDFYGVRFDDPVQSVKCNGGLFLSSGPIITPASMAETPDGLLKENYPKNQYYNKINIKNILAKVEPTFPSKILPGMVELIDPTPASFGFGEDPPIPSGSDLTIVTSTGFDKTSGIIEPNGDTVVLLKDIYIDGTQASVDSDKDIDVSQLGESPIPPNVFKIYVNTSYGSTSSFGSVATPVIPDPDFTPRWERTPGDSTGRRIKLDLNGKKIFSNSHLILGVELIGSGMIVSNGKINCLLGVDSSQVIIMSDSDLKIELSDKVSETRNKGFYYASDDLNVGPIGIGSSLHAATPLGGTVASQEYPPGSKFNSSGPTPRCVTVGQFVIPPTPDPDPGHGHHDNGWRRDYEGASMVIKKVLIDGDDSDYKIVAQRSDWGGGELWISLDDKGKANVHLGGNKIEILMSPTPLARLVDPNGNEISPLPAPLDAADLAFIAGEFKNQFGIPGKSHFLKGTLVGLNTYPAYVSNHDENDCELDTGSSDGFLTISENPSYMKDIIMLQGTNFKVRLVSCYEVK